jgi:hypothetical protein
MYETDEDIVDQICREIEETEEGEIGVAAQESLDAGYPVYYSEDDTPEGLLIKLHPCGRKELVRLDIHRVKPDEVVKVL